MEQLKKLKEEEIFKKNYNIENNITPTTIKKEIRDLISNEITDEVKPNKQMDKKRQKKD